MDFSLGEVSTGVRAALFAFLGLLLAPAAVYLPVSPVKKQQLELEQARRQEAALQSDVMRLQGIAAQRAPLERQVESERDELESLESRMPAGKDADEFIHMLEAAAAKSGIHVRRITSKPVAAREFHSEMPLEIEAEGSYFGLLDFFTALSRMTRINDVGDLTLDGFPEGSARPRSAPAGATVSATFTVTTFFTRTSDSGVSPGPEFTAEAAGKIAMSSANRLAQAQSSVVWKRTVLLLPFVIGVCFAEGWLAGAAPTQAGSALPRSAEMVAMANRKPAVPADSARPAAPASAVIVAAPSTSPTVFNAAATKTTTATGTSALVTPAPALGAAGKMPPAPALSAANQDRTVPNTAERRRDPFRPLVRSKDAGAVPFIGPPGKAGLSVNTLQVQGTMRDSDGMTAIVANPQGRVYFLHPGDQVYDAVVQSIGSGGVVFREHTQDSFGHPVERIVTRLVGPASGGTP